MHCEQQCSYDACSGVKSASLLSLAHLQFNSANFTRVTQSVFLFPVVLRFPSSDSGCIKNDKDTSIPEKKGILVRVCTCIFPLLTFLLMRGKFTIRHKYVVLTGTKQLEQFGYNTVIRYQTAVQRCEHCEREIHTHTRRNKY